MKKLVFIAAVVTALFCEAETLRLKFAATAEVIDEAGKVVGTRKLKAGTLISVDSAEAPAPKVAAAKGGKRLAPSDLSPIMFKTTRPASGATLRAKVKLDDGYYGKFDAMRGKFWSVEIFAYDADWESSEIFSGYISKSTPVGKKFIDLAKDGKQRRCLVKVTFAKDETFDDLLLIQDLEPLPDEE